MKKFFPVFFIILIVFAISCKTKKEVQSSNPTPQSSSQTVRLPQIEPQEKTLSPNQIEELEILAKNLAEAYCSYKSLQAQSESNQDESLTKACNAAQQKLEKMKTVSEEKIRGDLQKAELDKLYNQFKKKCD